MSSTSTAGDQGSSYSGPVSNMSLMLIVLSITVVVIVLVGALHLYLRYVWIDYGYAQWEWGWDRGTDAQNTQGMEVPTGLDKRVLDALPTFVYNKEGVKQSLECSVCISEFQENETGRLLPKCNHSFHTACIDMWFQSHSTCPLCRTRVGEEYIGAMPISEADASSYDVAVNMDSFIFNHTDLAEGQTGTDVADPLQNSSRLQERCFNLQRQQEDPNANSQAKQEKSVNSSLQYPVNTLFYGSKDHVTSNPASSAKRFQKLNHLVIEVPNRSSAIFLHSNATTGPRTTPAIPVTTPGNESKTGVSHLKTLQRILSMRERRSSRVSLTPKSSAEQFKQGVFTP